MKKRNLSDVIKIFFNKMANRGAVAGIIFGLLPAFLVLYVGYTYFIQPGSTFNAEQEKKVQTLEAEVNQGLAVEANREEFRAEFRKTIELFTETLPLLPKETEISNILFGLQGVAARYNVTLTGLNATKAAQKTPNADKLYEREYPAKVVGKYSDIMRFFLDVSKQDRILIIRNFKVDSLASKNSLSNQVAVDFSLLAYHAPQSNEYPTNIPADLMPKNPVQIAQSK